MWVASITAWARIASPNDGQSTRSILSLPTMFGCTELCEGGVDDVSDNLDRSVIGGIEPLVVGGHAVQSKAAALQCKQQLLAVREKLMFTLGAAQRDFGDFGQFVAQFLDLCGFG